MNKNLAVTRLSPFNYLASVNNSDSFQNFFHETVNSFFDDFKETSVFNSNLQETWSKTHPRVNSFKDKKNNTLVIDFVVPYYKKENLSLEIDEAKREIQVVGNNVNENIPQSDYISNTVSRSSFKKTLYLEPHEQYDFNSITAVHQDGILRLTLQGLKTKAEDKVKKVEIK